ncbi:hypothetical protein NM04_14835 [Massilia aurea]|uniref:Uncharacterized protein n=1 Tax=Massilia aurea TaxID=373040 RepID=A0A422QJ84_9BURK|nr:hypothetical protein [Massilia aurea]RNF30018.1 hypothetical protein NM04_14835 [Massilia aurea]
MKFIALARKFIEWSSETQPDPEPWQQVGAAGGWLTWDQILQSKRTVILAEGGSGKSTEFTERDRALNAQGKFSFHLTVKKVGSGGFENSLPPRQRLRFAQWRASDEPAWIFVDSVDEAKNAGVPLADALVHIADAIEGAEARAHVIFSGRPTDWEYRHDLDAVMALLPPPAPPSAPEAIDFDQLVINAIERERKQPAPPESAALIAIMAPLDNPQVEAFARAKEIDNVSEFLKGLEDAHLWPFARRPSDLDWLSKYWRGHGKFASFERMLKANLNERLTEADPARARGSRLDLDSAMRALERVGTAMVLGCKRDVEIDDSGNGGVPSDGLRLGDALSDVAPALQKELLSAAIFIPASAGLARLQNDNDGVVRSYLAARWLRRMLKQNCPWSAVRDLLFAQTYGVPTVKPSMAAVAAWLAIWEPRAAEELVKRQPFALVEHGDPSSLPVSARRSALRAIFAILGGESPIAFLHHEGLMRFATVDMQEDIKELWAELEQASESETQRQFLLRLIAEGRLRDCALIAFEAGVATRADPITRALAVRAIAEAGDDALRASYGEFVRREAHALDPDLVWSAFRLLFPVALTVDDLLAFLPELSDDERVAGQGLDFYGPRLAQRIDDLSGAKKLLLALFARLPQTAQAVASVDHESMAHLMPTIATLAMRVLDLDSALEPDVSAIDASLRLTALTWRHGWREEALTELAARLRSTPERRRAAIWRLCETHLTLEAALDEPLSDLRQLHVARLHSGVGLADLDWLTRDIQSRSRSNERLLAVHLAMSVWHQNDHPDWALGDIRKAAGRSSELVSAIETWVEPRPPSPEQLRMEENHARYEAESREREAKRKASWVSFAARVRDDPAQLDSPRPPDEKGVDSNLYHIWQLLDGLSRNSQGRSMSDVKLLEPIFGPRALSHIQRAFIRYWRLGAPKLRCERPPEDFNAVTAMELIGLVGVSIEAASDPTWPRGLSDNEAALATIYATLELNRFPKWFNALARRAPGPVRATLRRAFAGELSPAFVGDRREVLERIASSSDEIAALVADDLISILHAPIPPALDLLRLALRIARRGASDQPSLLALVLSKACESGEPDRLAAYLTCAFAINGDAATDALVEISRQLSSADQARLGLSLIPSVVGTDWDFGRENDREPALSTESLAKLTRFAFQAVHPAEDNDRSHGGVYSPDIRDNAQSARSALLKRLAATPGAATFHALRQLAADREFPVRKNWLHELGQTRAEEDSESAPWTARDVKAFEDDFDTIPRSPQDLQRVAMGRIEDLQHRLLHADFGLGVQFKALKSEVEVQLWVAGELQAKQGRSFTLEREAHVVEEKEPDIRLSSKGSDARLPIEIKVAESWSLGDLEKALTVQLMGRYLRDRNARWGILLLVHQNKPKLGWKGGLGQFLTFDETVARVRALAAAISASDSSGAQMQVGVIDVSSVELARTKSKTYS